jgi:hypothetical protein
MLRHESDIIGYAIHASDGAIGTIRDFLFDDVTWTVRWLVVDTGGWLTGREILLPPSALALVNHVGHQFNVNLTKQQVKNSPDVDSHRPVSRQHETSVYDYYGWSPYWGAGSYLDVVEYGGGGMMASPSMDLMRREKNIDDAPLCVASRKWRDTISTPSTAKLDMSGISWSRMKIGAYAFWSSTPKTGGLGVKCSSRRFVCVRSSGPTSR